MGAMFKLELAIAKQLRQVDCDANAQADRAKNSRASLHVSIGQEEKYQQLLQK